MTIRNEIRFARPTDPATAENTELIGLPDGVARSEPWSSRLLVSVRDIGELQAAYEAQVDVIDLKEPRDGPLAPVDPELWGLAVRVISGHRISTEENRNFSQSDGPSGPLLSAALGERDQAAGVAASVPPAFAFAKVGPSGCDQMMSLHTLWSEIGVLLPKQVELVAVAYADSDEASCLPPESVFRAAADVGIRRVLIDTFTKNGESTLDRLGRKRLGELSELAAELSLWWALAGSIRREHLATLWADRIRPDCIGVRGDVCHTDRTGALDPQRVKAWRSMLTEPPSH